MQSVWCQITLSVLQKGSVITVYCKKTSAFNMWYDAFVLGSTKLWVQRNLQASNSNKWIWLEKRHQTKERNSSNLSKDPKQLKYSKISFDQHNRRYTFKRYTAPSKRVYHRSSLCLVKSHEKFVYMHFSHTSMVGGIHMMSSVRIIGDHIFITFPSVFWFC